MFTQEINGFKIAKWNVHSFPEGVKYHTCPLCSESRKKKTQKCVVIHWETGLAKCSHCGEVIQLHEFEKKEQKEKKYIRPEWQNNTKLSDNVIKWFEGRKISQFIIRLMKITEGKLSMPDKKESWKVKNTIQFNYFRYGELINVKYRSGDKEFLLVKDAEKIPYNLDNVIGNEIIYFVEGEMDVLAVMECGIHNVTSPPNGFTKGGVVNLDWLNNDIEYFIKAEKLILAFDNDEAGNNGKREFIRRFGAHKCFSVDLKDCKDSNDFLIKYGAEELKKTLLDYKELPLENVSTYKDSKDKVRDFFLNGMPRGMVTGNMFAFDNVFSTNFSQILLVTGAPSSGKSEVVDQMCVGYAIKYGYKTAFASVENKPNELHHQKIIRKLNGITPREKSHFNAGFEKCEEFEDEHFYMIDLEGSYDLDRVLLKAGELVYRKGIRILVVDPFNKVHLKSKFEPITGNRINDYTNTYLSKLNDFAVKFDTLVILVAHPVKMEKTATGKRAIPDFYDVKGGGEFYDMCHHGIVVHRDYDIGLTLIRTLKVKFGHLGENNCDSWFKYNVNNGRLTDIQGELRPNETPTFIYDNDNWVTKDFEKVVQKEIFEIKPQENDWYNQENRIIDEKDVPF